MRSSPLGLVSMFKPYVGWFFALSLYASSLLQQFASKEWTADNNALVGVLEPGRHLTASSPKFTFMIASARRFQDAFYLNQTLDALLEADVPPQDITLLNADPPGHHYQLEEYLASTKAAIKVLERDKNVSTIDDLKAIRGLPFTVAPPKDQRALDAEHTDNDARKFWRCKEVMDFVLLAEHTLASSASEWIVLVQDDAVLIKEGHDYQHSSLIPRLERIVQSDPKVAYFSLAGTKGGAVALLFHKSFLKSLIAYVIPRFDILPIDWLIQNHGEELGVKHKILAIFAHVGKSSSLQDKASLVQSIFGDVVMKSDEPNDGKVPGPTQNELMNACVSQNIGQYQTTTTAAQAHVRDELKKNCIKELMRRKREKKANMEEPIVLLPRP